MNNRRLIHLVWLAALLVLLVGAGMTYQSAGAMNSNTKKFQQKLADLRMLENMQKERGSQIAARKTFEQIPARKPAPLTGLIEKALPDIKTVISPQEQGKTIPGWIVHRTKVDLGETAAPIGKILKLALQAESLRPPWQLTECHLWSSPQKEGQANAILIFETLERKELE